MSQYVLAQILNFERGFFAYHDRQKDQVWDQSMPKFRSLSELSVGVMGVGSIGYKSGERNFIGFLEKTQIFYFQFVLI